MVARGGGGEKVGTTAPPVATVSVAAGTGIVGAGLASDGVGKLFYSSGNAMLKRSPTGGVTPITTTSLVGPLGIGANGAGNLFVTERGEERGGYAVTVRRIMEQ